MNTSGQKKDNFEFIRKNLTELSDILHDPKFVLDHLLQNKLITMREYKEKTDDSAAILRLLLQKGEDRCQKFISLVLKNPEVQETYPRLEALDWASLDSPPPPIPERTSMPGQDPRPERRDRPGFGGHRVPGSSPMEIDFTTPQRMSNGSDVTEQQQNGAASMNPDDFQRSCEGVNEGGNISDHSLDLK